MSDEKKVDRRFGPRQKADGERVAVPLTEPERTGSAVIETLSVAGPTIETVDPSASDVRTIHFVEDGWTALGKSFYRGEELRVQEGSPTWTETVDRTGRSWLDLTEDDQMDIYERVYFRPGPWRGKGYVEVRYEDADAQPTEEELRRLEKRRQRQHVKSDIVVRS